MSNFLLQKSCRLLQESKHIKKTKKTEKQRKKKKNLLNLKELEEKEFQDNILRNLKNIKQFSEKCSVDVSEKVLPKCSYASEPDLDKKEEDEPTVFTEKDFEDFEKEYFDS